MNENRRKSFAPLPWYAIAAVIFGVTFFCSIMGILRSFPEQLATGVVTGLALLGIAFLKDRIQASRRN
jgi:predicted benzoate:H+ symporter BenE